MVKIQGLEIDSDDAHVDLTPLIDVIFMLVIFFILTMSFTHPAIEINIPKSSSASKVTEKKLLDVVILADGQIKVDGRISSYIDLENYLDEDSSCELNIIADENAPFKVFVKVVDIAKEKRNGRFMITAENVNGK